MAAENSSASKPPDIPWRVIVPIVLIGAVVLLMGLPLGAVWIVNNSGCCFANGPENVATFWASLIAGFLALFGMLITGVFIITAFRTTTMAQSEARQVARKEVKDYLERSAGELLKELEETVATVQESGQKAEQAITEAQQGIETQRQTASNAITNAQDEVTTAAGEAGREIGQAREGIEKQREAASGAITSAQVEVEAAAKEARERIDQATEGLPQTGGEPRSPDE